MSDEWLEDGSPAGGVGTIIRPAGQPAADPAGPGRTRPPRPQPAGPRRPQRPGYAPSREPKGAPPDDRGAVGGLGREEKSDEGRGKRAGSGAPETSGTSRVPFFVMLCGLLGGALVCALVISTTLAAGSFQITRLQQADTALARQRQLLQEQVATAQSAQVIQSRALQLGMRPTGELRFLNLRTGKIETDAGSGAVADIDVPGYTP
jgi:hypothetical protein